MTASPASGVPARVGPFAVQGHWHASEAGTLLSGVAPDGRPVDLVLLGPGPSSDAAARDRFRSAVEDVAARRPGSVLSADLRSPWPWAALPAGLCRSQLTPAGPAVEDLLLRAAVPPGSSGSAVTGPQFAPYWRGQRSRLPVAGWPGPAAGPVGAGVDRRWWLAAVLVILLLLLLFLLLLWWLSGRPPEPQPVPLPRPAPTAPGEQPTPGQPPMPAPGEPPAPGPSPRGPSPTRVI